MNDNAKYVIDTCSLTTLQRVYPYDVVPGAWDAISELADSGIIISSHEIFLELKAQNDGLFQWALKRQYIFLPLKNDIQIQATNILRNYPNLLDLKKDKSSADPFLIATAIVYSCSVVTEEKPTGPGAKIIKIPNVCQALNINCIGLLDLMRAEKVRLENSHIFGA